MTHITTMVQISTLTSALIKFLRKVVSCVPCLAANARKGGDTVADLVEDIAHTANEIADTLENKNVA